MYRMMKLEKQLARFKDLYLSIQMVQMSVWQVFQFSRANSSSLHIIPNIDSIVVNMVQTERHIYRQVSYK